MSIWSSEVLNLQDVDSNIFIDVAASGASDKVRFIGNEIGDRGFEVELSAGDAVRLARALLRASDRAYGADTDYSPRWNIPA